MKNKKLKNDLILLFILLLSALAVWAVLRFTQKEGAEVVVELDGIVTAKYPLDKDMRTEISSSDGHINVLVIKDGKAFIESADCPDKLCVKQHPISKAGESIICLPHRLMIRIEGERGADTSI